MMYPLAVITCYFCHNPITKMNGTGSDSLLMHHIFYMPEIKVPAHRGCNTSYHTKKRNEEGYIQKETWENVRKRFIESLGSDIICYFCGRVIVVLNGYYGDSLLIHHINEDENDNRFENLTPTHRSCNIRYHHTGEKSPMYGRKRSKETRRKMSVAASNPSPETRKKMSLAHVGQMPWNKGKTSNPASPDYDQRIQQIIETRKKNDPNNLAAQKTVRVRRINDPTNEWAKRGWKRRLDRYGPSGGNDKALKTRRKNDPNHKWAQRAWRRRRELYGPTGRKPK